jgi:hypothetical protein
MPIVLISILLLASLACGLLLVSIWRAAPHPRTLSGGTDLPPSRSPAASPVDPSHDRLCDAGAEVRDLALTLQSFVESHMARLKFATQPDLMLRMDRGVLREILWDVASGAICAAPGGQVLMTAMRQGGRIHITISDDGQAGDVAAREAALRDASRLVALQGGSLDIDSRAHEGTSVTIRLPIPSPAVRDSVMAAAPKQGVAQPNPTG